MKKIGVLAVFRSFDEASLFYKIIPNQIKMLLLGGYKPVAITTEYFEDDSIYPFSDVELIKIPAVFCGDRGELLDNYQERANKLKKTLYDAIKDLDVVITHNIICQPSCLIYNIVCRDLVKILPKIRWLHHIHSSINPFILCDRPEIKDAICQIFPSSLFIYPNAYDIPRMSKNYNIDENHIKCVSYPVDICEHLGFQETTKKLVDDKSMLSADVISCCPLRLNRDRQIEIMIKIFASLKNDLRKKVRLVIVDFGFKDEKMEDVVYREELIKLMFKTDLTDDDIIFMSQFESMADMGCLERTIRDLMLLSNVLILPSKSEAYSFVTQEAMLYGNFVVLNQDFPPIRDVYGSKYPKYFQFSSNINALTGYDGVTTTVYEDEHAYWRDIANCINYELTNNRVIAGRDMIRKEKNLKAIFKGQLEPLLYAKE